MALVLAPEGRELSPKEVVPADSRLLCYECVVFVKCRICRIKERVGCHISIVSVKVVTKAGAEYCVKCRAHSFLQSCEGVFDFAAELGSTGALYKVVVVFECASTGAALAFFVSSIADHSATGWEFAHTVFVCPCLVLFAVFAEYWGEDLPVYVIKVFIRPVVVVAVVFLESR